MTRSIFVSVYCVSFLSGLATTWLLPATQSLVKTEFDNEIKDDIVNNLESLTICGRFTCSVICLIFINDVARRIFVVSSVVVHAVTWCLLIIIFDIRQLLMYQFMFGVGIAFHDIISMIYISEVTSPFYRSLAVICDLFFYSLGVESYILANLLQDYSLLCSAALAFIIITISTTYYMLESPYYLMMREKETEAMFSLSILNSGGTADQTINLFKDLEGYHEEEKLDFYKSTTVRGNLKVFLFVVIVNAVAYVNFDDLRRNNCGLLSSSPFQLAIINLVGIALSTVPVLVFPRRFLLLGGFTVVAFLQVVSAIIFYVENDQTPLLPSFSQLETVVPLILFGIYVLVIYPTVYALRGEMFPYAMKIKGNALIEIFQLSIPVALPFILPSATTYLGAGFVYAFNGVLSWAIVVYVFVYYRDTKDKSLFGIRNLYKILN